MSTRSRGLHTATRYSTPALVVAEWLRKDRRKRDEKIDGALVVLSRFFCLILCGYEDPLSKKRNTIARLCATGIAGRVLREINRTPPTVDNLTNAVEAYLTTVNRLRLRQKLRFASIELEELRQFLFILHKQGEGARRSQRF